LSATGYLEMSENYETASLWKTQQSSRIFVTIDCTWENHLPLGTTFLASFIQYSPRRQTPSQLHARSKMHQWILEMPVRLFSEHWEASTLEQEQTPMSCDSGRNDGCGVTDSYCTSRLGNSLDYDSVFSQRKSLFPSTSKLATHKNLMLTIPWSYFVILKNKED
jgi:hypothetical protein